MSSGSLPSAPCNVLFLPLLSPLFYFLKFPNQVSRMAGPIKLLATVTKSDNLSSILETQKAEKENIPASCPMTYRSSSLPSWPSKISRVSQEYLE